MKNFAPCLVLFLTLSASATIQFVQTQKTWNCTLGGTPGALTCQITSNTHTTGQNLLAVWTFWQSSSTYTVSVGDSDSRNSFVSAIGPTIQSVSTPPISAQLFYAKNIHGTAMGINDVVTVTYTGPTSGSISLAGVVMVEYSGLDINYPLDSVSTGYSYATGAGTALDSGFAAPANTNLLIFGAGVGDTFGTATAGSSNFTDRADNNSSLTGVCGIAEDFIFQPAATALPTLQHANAKCTNSGNWAMQMAVFRDASWTVAGGWTPIRDASTLYADQYPGATPDAQISKALNAAASGQEVQYRCTPGKVLPNFAGTVTITQAVKLRLGGCQFNGPSSGYMFDVTANAVHIAGVGKEHTQLWSLSNTDLIHFEPAAASGGTWEVSNLDLEDNLIYSSTRTTGAAIHSDTGVGVVNTSSSGNSVSLVSGFPFSSGMVGTTLNIAGQNYVVATFVSSSSITLTTSPGNQTGVPYSTLNATVASAHDLLIDGFYDSIYVQGTNDTLFYNINARVPVESTFVFMGPGNSTTCLNCYSEHVGDQSWSSSTPGWVLLLGLQHFRRYRRPVRHGPQLHLHLGSRDIGRFRYWFYGHECGRGN